ncbi:uncharacterized protein LOC144492868 [Mustelus asterias]
MAICQECAMYIVKNGAWFSVYQLLEPMTPVKYSSLTSSKQQAHSGQITKEQNLERSNPLKGKSPKYVDTLQAEVASLTRASFQDGGQSHSSGLFVRQSNQSQMINRMPKAPLQECLQEGP